MLLLPTDTDDLLSARRWGAGPTAVVLHQAGGWTYCALANHIGSFAGDADRADVSATFLQPFLSYTTPDDSRCTVNTESTYGWKKKPWTVPVNPIEAHAWGLSAAPRSAGQAGRRRCTS